MDQTLMHAQRWSVEVRHALGDDERLCKNIALARNSINDPKAQRVGT